MIRKSMALSVAICGECQALMICNPYSQGFPSVCQKCGTPANVELSQDQRMQMERMQQHGHPFGGQSFHIRMG